MDRTGVEKWVADYERAWRTPGTGLLTELFEPAASYLPSPWAQPLEGLDAIGRFWEAERGSLKPLPARRTADFEEIDAWLAGALRAWSTDEASLPGPTARPRFCGPELWGKDLVDPPEGYWPPKH